MFRLILPLSLIILLQACATGMGKRSDGKFSGEIFSVTKTGITKGVAVSPDVATVSQEVTKIQTYSVSGKTIKDVSRNLSDPRSSNSLNLTYDYSLVCGSKNESCTQDNVASCKIQRVSVVTSASITIPVHNNKASLCSYASAVWERFEKNIKEFELGHVANLKQTSFDLARGLVSLTVDKKFKRCAQLKTSIQDLYDIHLTKLKFKNLEYDIQSDHGETAGACFGPHCEGYSKTEDENCGNSNVWK